MNKSEVQGIEKILDISTTSGVLILQNGGETYRTEETMTTIARSLGARSASAFVTPTVVMLTCVDEENVSHTRIQRINERTINLGKITRVNELSRRLISSGKKANLKTTEALLKRIVNSRIHSAVSVIFSTALSGFFFSLLFSGSIIEAVCAFCIGALMRTILYSIIPLGLSGFLVSITGGAVITLFSGLAVALGIVSSSGNISISVLMSLVPGLAIVNAIRDIIAGDLVAGSARVLEAFVVAAALSLGASFGLLVFPLSASSNISIVFQDKYLVSFVCAFFATACFAFFFNITKYDILWAALLGGGGWIFFLYVWHSSSSSAFAYIAGAFTVGALAEFLAIILKKPATIFIVPGVIPFVPGSGMYETMLNAVLGNGDLALHVGFSTLTAAGAIAVGLALASSIARLVSRFRVVYRARK